MGTVNRKDVAQKRNQGVWSTYKAIEWDGRIFKVGQLVSFISIFLTLFVFTLTFISIVYLLICMYQNSILPYRIQICDIVFCSYANCYFSVFQYDILRTS